MTDHSTRLADLGWSAHFAAQVDPNDLDTVILARVMAVHKGALDVAGPGVERRVPPFVSDTDPDPARHRATVGDWLVLDGTFRPSRLLERRSLFKRKSPGESRRVQLLAANIDTVFLVTSANDEFNPARLERYLALAGEAKVTPVIVITKADQVKNAGDYLDRARELAPGLFVVAIDARSAADSEALRPWLGSGQTVALLGSSGVGKSTLVNSLAGGPLQATAAVREGDGKGRHTTSGRSLHPLASGAWLLDTPGMRELQLVDAETGIDEVFDDVHALADTCRFSDCAHEREPGCAIQEAIAAGALDLDRLERYRKLVREERHNSESIAEARSRSRLHGKHAKQIFADKRRQRGEE